MNGLATQIVDIFRAMVFASQRFSINCADVKPGTSDHAHVALMHAQVTECVTYLLNNIYNEVLKKETVSHVGGFVNIGGLFVCLILRFKRCED